MINVGRIGHRNSSIIYIYIYNSYINRQLYSFSFSLGANFVLAEHKYEVLYADLFTPSDHRKLRHLLNLVDKWSSGQVNYY